MEERDADWERAHLRVEGNGVGERDADWERAHVIVWEWCRGGRHRLGESALDRVGIVWGIKSPTGRGRT